MSIIGTLLLGLIVGVLARSMLPGKQRMGWALICALGFAGLFNAGVVTGWFASVLGAVVLLVAGSLVQGKAVR